MKATGQKGFTLIELLLVIAIIGLLASIVTTTLISARDKSKDARRLTDVKEMTTALEMHLDTVGNYPISANAGTSVPGLSPTYISQIPVSPEPPGAGCSDTENDYLYRSINGSSYSLTFCLGTGLGSYFPGPYAITSNGVTGRYDINGDGVFDSDDPSYIAQFIVQIVDTCPLELCDVSGDGAIFANDASILAQILENQ